MTESYNEEVRARILKILNDKNLRQKALASITDKDEATISKMLKGQTRITVDRLAKIASYFNMSVIDILTYPEKYVPQHQAPEEPTEVYVQLKLKKEKKDQVLKLVFGENDIEILNK